MLSFLPSHARLPPLSLIVADLANPSPEQLGRALGVSSRTVRRWIAADQAPRSAVLALFWLTRWGRSELDAHLHAQAVNGASLVRALRRDLDLERSRLSRLVRLADFGASNSPLLHLDGQSKPGAFRLRVNRALGHGPRASSRLGPVGSRSLAFIKQTWGA
jgi:hypothetical protein